MKNPLEYNSNGTPPYFHARNIHSCLDAKKGDNLPDKVNVSINL